MPSINYVRRFIAGTSLIRQDRKRDLFALHGSSVSHIERPVLTARGRRCNGAGRLCFYSSGFPTHTGSIRGRAAPDRARDYGFAGLTSRREMGGASTSEHSACRPVTLFATGDEAVASYPGDRSDRGRRLVCGGRGHFSHGGDQRLTARKRTTLGFLIGAREPLPCSWVRVAATSSASTTESAR